MKNIIITGLFFSVTACLEYVTRAFKRREDVRVITAGSYHGLDMSVWGNGISMMPQHYDFRPDIVFPAMPIGESHIPIQMIESQLKDFIPDLWLNVDAGFRYLGKPSKGISAVFYTDPHTGLRDIYNRHKGQYDFHFNPQTPYLEGNEIYLPYASDKEWHERIEGEEKIYDVTIIGNYYQQRVELINKLKSKGLRTFFQLGYKGEEAKKIMNQSKIILNWSSKDDLTARCFETMGCGSVLLANRVPDLTKHFIEGEHYYGFNEIGEAESKVDYILSHWEEAEKVANNGYKISNELHRWDHRVAEIMKVTGV